MKADVGKYFSNHVFSAKAQFFKNYRMDFVQGRIEGCISMIWMGKSNYSIYIATVVFSILGIETRS